MKRKNVINRPAQIGMWLLCYLLAAPAFSAGFEPVNKLLKALIVGMHSISIATATLAGLWVAFKVLWRKEALAEMSNVIIGACIIVGIAEFVAYIL